MDRGVAYLLMVLFLTAASASVASAEVVFSSDWSTATGNSDLALTDGDKWTGFQGSNYADRIEVVSTTGMPTPNALRANINDVSSGMLRLDDQWPIPEVGEYLFFRKYFRVNADATSGYLNLHWFQSNSLNPNMLIAYEWVISPENGAVYTLDWHLISRAFEQPVIPHKFVLDSALEVGTTYRLEVRLHRTDTLRAKSDVRIYEGDSTTVLYDSSDFMDSDFPGESLASQNPDVWLEDVVQLNRFEVGNNGPAASAGYVIPNLFEVAAFSVGVSSDPNDWIGPYSAQTNGLCEATGSGTCYYVDPVAGSDANDGSFSAPWASLDNIVYHYGSCPPPNPTSISAGDVVYFREGIHDHFHREDTDAGCDTGTARVGYLQGLTGTQTNPIVFASYPGEHAVFDSSGQSMGFYLESSDWVVFRDLEITNTYGRGISTMGSNNIEIVNVTIHDTDGVAADNHAAIELHSSINVLIANSTFYDNYDHAGGSGNHIIMFRGANQTIIGNTFDNSASVYSNGGSMYCVHYKHGSPHYNSFTHIYDNEFTNCQGFGVRTAQQNTHIRGNIFRNGDGAWMRRNVNYHNYVNISIEYNTFYDATFGIDEGPFGDVQTPSYPVEPAGLRFANNIMYFTNPYGGEQATQVLMLYGTEEGRVQLLDAYTSDMNCYYDEVNQLRFYFGAGSNLGPNNGRNSLAQWQAQGFDVNSVHTDPLFINAGAGDFRLQQNSPCAAMGHTVINENSEPPVDTSPPTVSITAPSAGAVLSSGTTSTTLSVSTNEVSSCRYSSSDQSYASMSNTLSGSTSHSATLTGLSDGGSYTFYVRCQDGVGNANIASVSVSFSVAQSGSVGGPVVSVSSSYSGYSSSVIDDGVIDADGGTATTWASSESTVTSHWIEFDFGEPTSLSSFTVYWTMFSGSFFTSQQLLVERWDGSSWQSAGSFTRSTNQAASTISTTGTASRWRIVQPANSGNPTYSSIIWLTEVDYSFGSGSVFSGGDVNEDGVVNVQDILIVVSGLGRQSFDVRADRNGDGVVNVFDLVLVARHFGVAQSSSPSVDGVCGSRAMVYSSSSTSWPGGSSYCSSGSASSSPAFPAEGSMVNWNCVGSGGGSTASCSASRQSSPSGSGTLDFSALESYAGEFSVVERIDYQSSADLTRPGWGQFEGDLNGGGQGNPASPPIALLSGSTPTGDGQYARFSLEGVHDGWTPRYHRKGVSSSRIGYGLIMRWNIPSTDPNAISWGKGPGWVTTTTGNGWSGYIPPGRPPRDPTAAMGVEVFTSRIAGSDYAPNLMDPIAGAVPFGEWFSWEVIIDTSTGEYSMYWNGELAATHTTGTSGPMVEFKFPYITLGGGSGIGPLTANDYIDVDAVYVMHD